MRKVPRPLKQGLSEFKQDKYISGAFKKVLLTMKVNEEFNSVILLQTDKYRQYRYSLMLKEDQNKLEYTVYKPCSEGPLNKILHLFQKRWDPVKNK